MTSRDYLAFGKIIHGSKIYTYKYERYIELGTCAMKPRENGGVVNPRLNVYGAEGLKVAGQSRSDDTRELRAHR